MVTFIMLTRLGPEAVRSPQALEQLERKAMERVPGCRMGLQLRHSGALQLSGCFSREGHRNREQSLDADPYLRSCTNRDLDGDRVEPVQGNRADSLKARCNEAGTNSAWRGIHA